MMTASTERTPDAQARLLTTLERLLALQVSTVKAALDEARGSIAAALDADKVDVFLCDPAQDTLVAIGVSATSLRRMELQLDCLSIKDSGRSGWVLETGQTHCQRMSGQDATERATIYEQIGVHAVIAVPVDVDGVRRGVLQVDAVRSSAFSAQEIAFLQAVAHWMGLLIQRMEHAEQRVQEAAETTRRQVAEELLTVLAHDLGNYLTPLIGRAYLLERRAVQDGRSVDVRDAQSLARGLERQRRMIADILDAGRLEHGLLTLDPEPVDLVALVHETVELLQTPKTEIQVEAPLTLPGVWDSERLRQVVQNVLTNALKHTSEGTTVVLRVTRECEHGRGWAVLRIQDAGPGIPPAVLPHIFERFMSGRRSKGLGLGLFLARSLAEAHGGTLTVESTNERGTVFRLALPLADG